VTNKELAKHWTESAENDFKVMTDLFASGHFAYSLYFGHLALEKMLKGCYALKFPTEPQAPFIHDLLKLAKICGIETNPDIDKKLGTVNTFNVKARYEPVKSEFYARCTKSYTETQIKNIKEIQQWLKATLTKM